MNYFYSFCFFLISTTSFSQQTWDDFSGEERAFFYHVCRRVEILKPELFHLFEFTDSIPWVNDTLPDYPYVEKKIVQHPEKLILHTDEMARKSNGLVSDLATAYALWELDKVLHFRASVDEKDKPLKEKLKIFEHYVLEEVPQTAVNTLTNGDYVLMKGVSGYYSPSLSVTDKLASLKNSGYSQSDQMLILNALMMAQEKYVQNRSYEIFGILGGKCEDYQNFLSAAGDGSSWSDLKGGFKTPYNQSLPDDKGLFKFEAEEYVEKVEKITGEIEIKKPIIRINDIIKKEFRTKTDKATVIHFDVQGYHPERQTTIAIQKGGSSYILYGKNEHRLVSPDSSYGVGTTYWRLLWELEHTYIADLNERLYGKRGYEYWIDIYEKKIAGTELLIKKTEFKLDQLRHTPMGQPKMKKKKFKKKNLDNSDQISGHPKNTVTKTEKKKGVEQNRLVHLNTQLVNEKSTLVKLKKEMEEAYFLLVKYQTLYDKMQKNLGYIFMSHEVEGNIYTFADGATFNYATQDFTFPATNHAEVFHLYHISFGERVLSTSIDENFVHLNLSSVNLFDKFTYCHVYYDRNPTLSLFYKDSIQQMEIFQSILNDNLKVEMIVRGGGIVGATNNTFFRDSTLSPIPFEAANYESDDIIIFRAVKGSVLTLSVIAWDRKMISEKMSLYQSQFVKLKSKYPDLNEVDYYTGMVAKKFAEIWLAALKNRAQLWFKDAGSQAKILKTLNSVKVGNVQFLNGKVEANVPNI